MQLAICGVRILQDLSAPLLEKRFTTFSERMPNNLGVNSVFNRDEFLSCSKAFEVTRWLAYRRHALCWLAIPSYEE